MHPDNPENVERQMSATRAALSEKIESLEEKVAGTVEQAATVVGETVEAAKATAANVRDTLDLAGHVRRRPWLMMGGAIATGYVVGRLLAPALASCAETAESAEVLDRPEKGHHGNGKPRSLAAVAARAESDSREAAQSSGPRWTAEAQRPPRPATPFEPPPESVAAQDGEPSGIGTVVGDQLGKLKNLAVGALFGLLRGLTIKSLSPEWAEPVGEVFDNISREYGGTLPKSATAKS